MLRSSPDNNVDDCVIPPTKDLSSVEMGDNNVLCNGGTEGEATGKRDDDNVLSVSLEAELFEIVRIL